MSRDAILVEPVEEETERSPSLSPALLITLLHFYYTAEPGPHRREITEEHLIRLQSLKLATIVRKGWPSAELTPLGKAYVKLILATPRPRPVECFVDGRTGEFIKP